MLPESIKSLRIAGSLLLSICLIGALPTNAQIPDWVAPKDAQAVKNPMTSTAPLLADAKVLYTSNCGPCHGEKGKGDGPAAQGLSPKPADHTSAVVQSESDGSLFWKLSEGHNPMPAYKKVFTEQQRWALVLYIRTLAKNTRKK
jgi:mono/diheme cytochrome c family protein